ncbi:hypothetical protein B0H13DRAFT_2379258 [Mycena leptocephala]|nr:hypothetical protein B0H13DRAFT_2379258 [Mycena leptocephala]
MSSQEIAIADAVIATMYGDGHAPSAKKIVKLLWEEQLAKNRPSALRALALALVARQNREIPRLEVVLSHTVHAHLVNGTLQTYKAREHARRALVNLSLIPHFIPLRTLSEIAADPSDAEATDGDSDTHSEADGESDAHSEADGDSNDSQSTAATIHDTGLLEGECVENVWRDRRDIVDEAEKAWFRLRVAAHRYRESLKARRCQAQEMEDVAAENKEIEGGEDDDENKENEREENEVSSFLLPALLPAFEGRLDPLTPYIKVFL